MDHSCALQEGSSGAGEATARAADASRLLARAAVGDRRSWEEIVDRYAGLIAAVTRGFRLSAADAADVSQATWLRLVENVARIRQPGRLSAWIATTARRECINAIRRGARDVPTDAPERERKPALVRRVDTSVEGEVLRGERDAELWAALRTLPPDCQRLLRVLVAEPGTSYAEAAAELGIAVGSVGPTRARCLATLRRRLEAAGAQR
jgi:RNA polymerase sigma factor (sigma-70 family)